MDYLNRREAHFPDELWAKIDKSAVEAARDRLTGRRFLPLEGPFGIGLTAIECGDDDNFRQPGPEEAAIVVGHAISVPMIRRNFRISIRRIAAYLENGQPLDLTPVEDAAEAVADSEETLIYRGAPDFQLPGLLTAPGHQSVAAGDWAGVERALADVVASVTALDEAGFRGPYALVLSPALYNGLFRLYPGTDVMQLEHLRRLCTLGIFKAAIEGGAVIDPSAGTIILGQDMRAGYAGQDGIHYQLYLTENLVLRVDDPQAVCVIPATVPSAATAAAHSAPTKGEKR